ncbi:hypothetical protein CXR23_07050 [Brevibacterium aurantiacum]|uniref:Uncharacterized protein n=1 Tax=Brevibacterium aurantiacum TaxID=273384 RepID=A0A3Q9NQV9_BREAU|nr:hypothetical protein CXR23_07050 [Brevibacterium aurantiacum]
MRTDFDLPNPESRALAQAVDDFLDEIVSTIEGSVRCDLEVKNSYVSPPRKSAEKPGNGFRIGHQLAVSLKVDSTPTYRLEATYVLIWNGTRQFIAVSASAFGVFIAGSNEPLFHYDYYREPEGKYPGAHLNIHHDRDDLRAALSKGGNRHRAKARHKQLAKGKTLSDSELHYPLGGPRFRPCLEDVIQFMIYELGVDTKDGWEQVLKDGRTLWRDRQLRTAVTDNLHVAAEVLRSRGFKVEGGPEPDRNDRRITEL